MLIQAKVGGLTDVQASVSYLHLMAKDLESEIRATNAFQPNLLQCLYTLMLAARMAQFLSAQEPALLLPMEGMSHLA